MNSTLPSAATATSMLAASCRLIQVVGHWCQGVTARDASGNVVLPTASSASQWDAYGALMKCASAASWETRLVAEELLRNACYELFHTRDVSVVNDRSCGHECVVRSFALAMEMAARLEGIPDRGERDVAASGALVDTWRSRNASALRVL